MATPILAPEVKKNTKGRPSLKSVPSKSTKRNPLAFKVVEAELKRKQLAKKQEAELSVKTTQKTKQTKKPVDQYEESNQ
jgi:hypothetical protein